MAGIALKLHEIVVDRSGRVEVTIREIAGYFGSIQSTEFHGVAGEVIQIVVSHRQASRASDNYACIDVMDIVIIKSNPLTISDKNAVVSYKGIVLQAAHLGIGNRDVRAAFLDHDDPTTVVAVDTAVEVDRVEADVRRVRDHQLGDRRFQGVFRLDRDRAGKVSSDRQTSVVAILEDDRVAPGGGGNGLLEGRLVRDGNAGHLSSHRSVQGPGFVRTNGRGPRAIDAGADMKVCLTGPVVVGEDLEISEVV